MKPETEYFMWVFVKLIVVVMLFGMVVILAEKNHSNKNKNGK